MTYLQVALALHQCCRLRHAPMCPGTSGGASLSYVGATVVAATVAKEYRCGTLHHLLATASVCRLFSSSSSAADGVWVKALPTSRHASRRSSTGYYRKAASLVTLSPMTGVGAPTLTRRRSQPVTGSRPFRTPPCCLGEADRAVGRAAARRREESLLSLGPATRWYRNASALSAGRRGLHTTAGKDRRGSSHLREREKNISPPLLPPLHISSPVLTREGEEGQGHLPQHSSRLGELLRRLGGEPGPALFTGGRLAYQDSGSPADAKVTICTPAAPTRHISHEQGRDFGIGTRSFLSREDSSMVKADEEVQGYVPLLFRSDFVLANPHARRHAASALDAAGLLSAPVDRFAERESCIEAPSRKDKGETRGAGRSAEASSGAAVTSFELDAAGPPVEWIGSSNVPQDDLRPATNAATVDREALPSSPVGCGDPVELLQEPRKDNEESGPSFHTTDAEVMAQGHAQEEEQRRSRRLILDPLEWLSQASDAPLMDEALLESSTEVTYPLAQAVDTSVTPPPGLTASLNLFCRGAPAKGTAAVVAARDVKDGDGAVTASHGESRLGKNKNATETAKHRLQLELEAELYADVPRAIRKQQWHRPRRGSNRKKRSALAEETALTPPRPCIANLGEEIVSESASLPFAVASMASSGNSREEEEKQHRDQQEDDLLGEGAERVAAVTASASATPTGISLDSDTLIYNVFTRRVAKSGSLGIRDLALMGIGVSPGTRELRVTDSEALLSLARELRAQRVSWPQLWSRGFLYRQVQRLLSDATVEDPVERVNDLLKLQYAQAHQQRQTPGLVLSSGAPTSDTAASGSAWMVEQLDEKLLTLQDLNEEQQAVVALVMQGHHTYIGGGAGTGKSVLLRVLKQQLTHEGLVVAMTGTTGIAGSQICGSTLHHCLGINLLGEFMRRKDLSSYDVIIIDEVSMLSRELFESLEAHLRRANSPSLPFGGVQMIVCGDFLQLGAIHSQPIITSPLFRRNFVHLKLRTVVRQNQNPRFASQLQQLRRGLVPLDLPESVHMVSHDALCAEQQAAANLRARQQALLKKVSPLVDTAADAAEGDEAAAVAKTSSSEGHHDEPHEAVPPSSKEVPDVSVVADAHTKFVDNAVRLLPTNREVDEANAQQLQRLPGDLITYTPQFLPPSLVGNWSPTYVLRILEPATLQSHLFVLEIHRHLTAFYTHGQRASSSTSSPSAFSFQQSQRDATLVGTSADVEGDDASTFSDGSWLLQPLLRERNVVLYRLFADAFALRVHLPPMLGKEEARQFLLYLGQLDRHLQRVQVGVRVRDVLLHADGMHTEQDEFTLTQYASRAPLARSLQLKVGARVMLRTNFAPGLVNGSLGTVIDFQELQVDRLPRYIVGNAQREQVILQYREFLQLEHGFDVPVVPVVDFNGRRAVIPPVTQYVGGGPNTHHYSVGVVALPLSLAYAFTVHKVQGLTLVGRVHLELSRMWPCEHLLYVAMSRVRNPEQLSVSSFRPELVRVAADCLLFDDSLPSVAAVVVQPYMVAATWRRAPDRRKKALMKKRMDAYNLRRQHKLQAAAKRGDLAAEVRLLEERMLKQRVRMTAAATRQNRDGKAAISGVSHHPPTQ